MTGRPYTCSRGLYGGCHTCHGDKPHWFGPNTQGVAASKYDATVHTTWM